MILGRVESTHVAFGYKTQHGMVVECAPYMRDRIIGMRAKEARAYLEHRGFKVCCLD
jgi:hypothetical protein